MSTLLKRSIKSEYPLKVVSERINAKLRRKSESIEKRVKLEKKLKAIDRKVSKRIKKRGVLPRCISEAQRKYKMYWQSRLKLASIMWIRRILKKSQENISQKVEELDSLRLCLDNHRTRIIDDLRRAGDIPECPEQCSIIPPSTQFHSYLLTNEIVGDFAISQRSISEDAIMTNSIIERFNILSDQMRNTILKTPDVMYDIVSTLYPIFGEGLFKIDAYDECIQQQVEQFFATLEDRLSSGDQFRFFASLEENSVIIDSGVFIFCHQSAFRFVGPAMINNALNDDKLIGGAYNPNRITAIRILQDINVKTLSDYFGYKYRPAKKTDDVVKHDDIWTQLRKPHISRAIDV